MEETTARRNKTASLNWINDDFFRRERLRSSRRRSRSSETSPAEFDEMANDEGTARQSRFASGNEMSGHVLRCRGGHVANGRSRTPETQRVCSPDASIDQIWNGPARIHTPGSASVRIENLLLGRETSISAQQKRRSGMVTVHEGRLLVIPVRPWTEVETQHFLP